MAKAATLLKEAGYKGEPISVNSYPGEYEPMIATLQAQLKKVGINVKIEMMDFGAHRARIRSGDYTLNVTGGNLETDPYEAYGANRRCESDLKKRRNNLSGHCDKEVEAWLDQAEQELDNNKRRALFKQILQKHLDDVAEIYLRYAPRFFSMREYVKGFNTSGDDGLPLVGWRSESYMAGQMSLLVSPLSSLSSPASRGGGSRRGPGRYS